MDPTSLMLLLLAVFLLGTGTGALLAQVLPRRRKGDRRSDGPSVLRQWRPRDPRQQRQ